MLLKNLMRLIGISLIFVGGPGLANAKDVPMETVFAGQSLPPLTGKTEPRIMPEKGEDGLYHHSWFKDSFLDLKEDVEEARENGKQVFVLFEMRGCPYCKKLQQNIFSAYFLKNYLEKNFDLIQINIYGSKQVTDLDGEQLSEKQLARKWGVRVTPTAFFLVPDAVPGAGNNVKNGKILLMPSPYSVEQMYDLFTWVQLRGYNKGVSAARFLKWRSRKRDGF